MSRKQVNTQRQLQNTRGGYYTGATNDPARRMREHIRDGLMKPGEQMVYARTQNQCYAEDRLGPRRYNEQDWSNAREAPGYTYVLR